MSSAYRMTINVILDLMSLIKILNNKGPTIEPCGTPVLINYMDDFTSSMIYLHVLFPKFFKSDLAVPFTP